MTTKTAPKMPTQLTKQEIDELYPLLVLMAPYESEKK